MRKDIELLLKNIRATQRYCEDLGDRSSDTLVTLQAKAAAECARHTGDTLANLKKALEIQGKNP